MRFHTAVTACRFTADEPPLSGGVALRFARVKGLTPDKRPEDADTIEAVLAIHEGISG